MTWRERIAAARERGKFTGEDYNDAARSWCTCAVGEQREKYGAEVIVFYGNLAPTPVDGPLLMLGGTERGFANAVGKNDFDSAEDLLDAIEDRALALKRGAVSEGVSPEAI